jgi:hypothetical protein
MAGSRLGATGTIAKLAETNALLVLLLYTPVEDGH